MAACPPLEDIAAFLDGMLSPEERARITEHLARCESCYEIFAGAVHFLEEERESSADDIDKGDVLPFPLVEKKDPEKQPRVEPIRPPRRVSRWFPLAASVVLAAGLGYMLWQNSRALPEVTVVGLAEPLQGRPGLMKHLYNPNPERGAKEAAALISEAPPFLVGVYLMDLQLSTAGGDVKATQDTLYALSGELDEILGFPDAKSFKKEADQMTGPEALRRFATKLPQETNALENWFADAEYPLFRFGLWTEAGRLAAEKKSPKFFEQRVNRRFLSAIPREIRSEGDHDRYGPILNDLQQIEPLWDREKRSSADYDDIARHFKSIIDQMERIQKEDQEDDLSPEP